MYSKTVIVGRCGRDPEIKYTQSGRAVCDVSLAEDRGYGDTKQTVWWRLTFWGEKAESVNQHVKKGDVLIVDGVADVHAWNGENGEARAQLELTVFAWRFGGGGRRGEEQQGGEDDEAPF
jgi:single-strand DNA-binding protein